VDCFFFHENLMIVCVHEGRPLSLLAETPDPRPFCSRALSTVLLKVVVFVFLSLQPFPFSLVCARSKRTTLFPPLFLGVIDQTFVGILDPPRSKGLANSSQPPRVEQ